MRGSRPGYGPIVVLAIAALVPALVLFAAQRSLRDGSAGDLNPGAPVPAGAETLSVNSDIRDVLSLRRSAAELSGRLNRASLVSALAPVTAAMDPRSCLVATVDGVQVLAVGGPTAIPASTVKILVAAAAIDVLGEDHRFTTVLLGPQPSGGVVSGDVVLVGGGDPLLSGDWYATSGMERHPVLTPTSLDELARQLAASGISRIDGRILGDGSRYDDEFYVDDWADGVAGIEAGPYSALIANDSRVEGDAYRWDDPIAGAAAEFSLRLTAAGVANSGGGGRGTVSPDLVELASIQSVPLSAVVAEMLTTSDNNTAEMLLKELDVVRGGSGTRLGGIDVVKSALISLGVPIDDLRLVDGSGLANSASVRCETLVAAIDRSHEAVVSGLPIAGRTGTLSEVFIGTPMEERLSAKTGTLGNPPYDKDPPAVKALAGRFETVGGEEISFALLLNQYMVNDQANYRPIWDALAVALASYPAGPGIGELGP